MSSRILVIDGHPDVSPGRYVHALAEAYRKGAEEAGHQVRSISVGKLGFAGVSSNEEFMKGAPPPAIAGAQESLRWAEHVVILFPLWLGSMPGLLKGRSARIIVTMGMPAFFYRWYYRAHSLKSLERNILAFCGIAPVRSSIVGMVEGMSAAQREKWLEKIRALGRLAR